ncbi:squalene synthase HpnC [Neisseria sp. Ec49-e6-T10]|uniref:squalene synthase HpnC n=1 Tax=Neisseria sp. Ec49-e6-T10 TaxID=3140744 RepID=UPI003EBC4A9B
MSVDHYENFPVGSVLLPRRLRKPIHAIYHFARTADDYADEGEFSDEQRIEALIGLKKELDLIDEGKKPKTELMNQLLDNAIVPFSLPLKPFYDLLSAFCQDVSTKRYEHFGDLIDYCRRSANPIGTLLLHLYGVTDKRQFAMSDAICTSLQLINFWQDVAVDWQKQRVYIPQEDLQRFNVSEEEIAQGKAQFNFQNLMRFECDRTHKMLLSGSPLGLALKGRIGFELRMIVLGGQRILYKLDQNKYNMFEHRPVLQFKDWCSILKRAFLKK